MKVLIIGNGGREHALAWKASLSAKTQHVFVAPGNAGTALENKVCNIPIAANDIDKLLLFAKQEEIDLTIVGPETALAAGIVDRFTTAHLACLGPIQMCAMLETSKAYSKAFMQRYRIPTAHYAIFEQAAAAKLYIRQNALPIVIKADGLAAGKGVIIVDNLQDGDDAIDAMLSGQCFGTAGSKIIIEEYLSGEEVSFIVIAHDQKYLPLASAQDHKKRDNDERGLNTGGMGAYSPAPIVTPELQAKIISEVIQPTLYGIQQEGYAYTGFLYAGLMINKKEEIKVLEYNCRLGDPEAQAILLRLQTDFIDLCLAALDKRLTQLTLEWDPRYSLGVIAAAQGYPEEYRSGDPITGLTKNYPGEQKIFHAGTVQRDDVLITAGGRVLCAAALGDTLEQAQAYAYQMLQPISWPGIYYRTDIGNKGIQRQKGIKN